MRSNRPSFFCLVLAGFALGMTFGASGCSDSSRQSGTQVQVLEADQQRLRKAAEGRLEKAKAKAKLPRSKQGKAD